MLYPCIVGAIVIMLCGAGYAERASAETFAHTLCKEQPAQYVCMTAKKLAQKRGTDTRSWVALLPDKAERVFVQQLNRSTRLAPDTLLALPRDGAYDMARHAPLPVRYNTHEPTLVYDPHALAWGMYNEHGALIRWGLGIGGKSFCSDIKRSCRTISGTFRILYSFGKDHRSSKYPIGCGKKKAVECAPTPYMLTFHEAGYGFHASSDLPGEHASHGCVRTSFEDARWLHANVPIGTLVIVLPY